VCLHFTKGQPTALPFGSSLSASLACCVSRCLRQFTCVGLGLQPCSPTNLDAGSRETSSRLSPRPIGRSSVVTAASHTTVASCAGAVRLLRTEPQVRLMVLSISNDYLSDFHVAREANRALVTAVTTTVSTWETNRTPFHQTPVAAGSHGENRVRNARARTRGRGDCGAYGV